MAINGDIAEHAMRAVMNNASLQNTLSFADTMKMARVSKFVWDAFVAVQKNLAMYDVARVAAISSQMNHIGEVMTEHVDMLSDLPFHVKADAQKEHMIDCAMYLVYDQCSGQDRDAISTLLDENAQALSLEQRLAKGTQLWTLLTGEGLPLATRDMMHRTFPGPMNVRKLQSLLPSCRRAWQRYTENRAAVSGFEWATMMQRITELLEPVVCRMLPAFNRWSSEASSIHSRSGEVMRRLADRMGLELDESFLMEAEDYDALMHEAIRIGDLRVGQIAELVSITSVDFRG